VFHANTVRSTNWPVKVTAHCLRGKCGLHHGKRYHYWFNRTLDCTGQWQIVWICNVLTCIDTASNIVELVRVDNKTSDHIRDKFAQTWLCQYPRPIHCVHDKGGEFIGSKFQWLLELFSIKYVCSTSKIPQFNAICEWMHQTPPKTMTSAKDMVDSAMHVMRTTAIAFARNMFLNVPLLLTGKRLHAKRNNKWTRIYIVLIRKGISTTTPQVNKSWTKCTIQLRWE
jgi:hypothetical protein